MSAALKGMPEKAKNAALDLLQAVAQDLGAQTEESEFSPAEVLGLAVIVLNAVHEELVTTMSEEMIRSDDKKGVT